MFPAFTEDPFTTPQARRQFLRYSISEDNWTTRSGSSILKELGTLGVGIRRQDFFEIRREKMAEIARKEDFKSIPSDGLVPYSLMNADTNITLTNTAQYRIRMTVIDKDTGEAEYLYRSIGSDEHHTRGFIEEFASTMFSMGGKGYDYNIVASELHDVWLTPGGHLTA